MGQSRHLGLVAGRGLRAKIARRERRALCGELQCTPYGCGLPGGFQAPGHGPLPYLGI